MINASNEEICVELWTKSKTI